MPSRPDYELVDGFAVVSLFLSIAGFTTKMPRRMQTTRKIAAADMITAVFFFFTGVSALSVFATATGFLFLLI
jgi:hypothetical protein